MLLQEHRVQLHRLREPDQGRPDLAVAVRPVRVEALLRLRPLSQVLHCHEVFSKRLAIGCLLCCLGEDDGRVERNDNFPVSGKVGLDDSVDQDSLSRMRGRIIVGDKG